MQIDNQEEPMDGRAPPTGLGDAESWCAMPLLGAIYIGSLFVSGTAFALFLGVASSRVEHRREHDLELSERREAATTAVPPPTH